MMVSVSINVASNKIGFYQKKDILNGILEFRLLEYPDDYYNTYNRE
jgi:hypothetical protein